MYTQSPESSILNNTPASRFLDGYKKILTNIIYGGLLLFFGAIYIFPNDSGMEQTFYLLVLLPFLLLFPICVRELPWKNRNLYIYMAFPAYMLISHYWAPEENVTRDWFFFIKQFVYFFVFLASIFLVMKEKSNFILDTLYFLIIVGFLSSLISIGQHALISDNFLNDQMRGFSIVDIDKAGAIYALHAAICAAYLVHGSSKRKNNLILASVTVFILVDLLAVYLTHTVGNIIIVSLIPAIIFLYLSKNRRTLMLGGCIIVLAVGFFVFNGALDWALSDPNIKVRVDMSITAIHQWSNNMFFGIGLSYKLPIAAYGSEIVFPHPHNILTDTLRFGGAIGFGLFILQFSVPVIWKWLIKEGSFESTALLIWFICGAIAATFYAQQPYVRPGSYIWFFYWMPVTLLTVCMVCDKNNSAKY